MNSQEAGLSELDSFLVLITGPFFDGVLRFGIGLLIIPSLKLFFHAPTSFLHLLGSLLAVLCSLRVVPAICRRFIPFSRAVQKIWSDRRQVAKRHDSYQWRKMFWVGLGLSLYSIHAHAVASSVGMIGILFLLLGSIALLRWSALVSTPN